MKKIIISMTTILILSICCLNTVSAKEEVISPSEIEIPADALIGNTNGNIANGGYMVGNQKDDNIYYAYITVDWEKPQNPSELNTEPSIIKYEGVKGTKVLTTGFNCRCINNYNDEWIYYLKDNDGKIYRSKTDGSHTETLKTEFYSDIIYIIGDFIIAQTNGYDKGNIVAIDLEGKNPKVIVNEDSRLRNMMLNIDENYIYYYNELDNRIYRISYDGKTRTELYEGAVDAFQIYDNKLYVKGRDESGKKDILYIYNLNDKPSGTFLYHRNSDYKLLSSIEYINEFNVCDFGVFFVRSPYGNAFLYHSDLDGQNIEWVNVRTVFDWSIYVINDNIYQYDVLGGAMDKAAEIGNINYMSQGYYGYPDSYIIN